MSENETAPTQLVNPARDPFADKVIGERYRVVERIGEGGMGTVFRVEHVLMKKTLALKLLRPEFSNVTDAARRFEREAQSASRLNHPNIISVTDFGHGASGELFLVMEFVAGEPLSDVLAREGRLEVGRACRIAAQILRALEHAHAEGVVHRDLKPANVMLVKDPGSRQPETVKILDFGIAKMTQAQGGDEPLTRGMMVFGTPAYMSPEQATGQEADSRADLYSCGIILFEMLAGRKPFDHEDLVKLLGMQITAPPPRISEVASDVSIASDLEAVVMRVLQKDRERRYATAVEFREALERASTDVAELGARFAARSVRMGFSVGAKLWAKRSAVVALLRRGWTGLCWVKAKIDKLAHPALKFVPEKLRRFVVPALLVLLLGVPLLVRGGGQRGEAPRLSPPKPKPVPVELKPTIKTIEENMAKGRLTEARVAIMQMISAHPKDGRVRYLLGNLEFADKNPSAGLQAYEEALRLDPGLRGDAALLVNVRGELNDKKLGFVALEMLAKQVGQPASDVLADVATDDRRSEFRTYARQACESLDCLEKVDLVASYGLDLSQGRNCEEKREAVRKLGQTGDKRAIEPLKRARSERRSFLGGILSSSGNRCIIKDIDAALTALGEPPQKTKAKAKAKRRRR
ncbi:MAG: protein kinase [Deltaproteobacteria bacterium]|nr:protein kinase [Deltaproteobacteria bacterium]